MMSVPFARLPHSFRRFGGGTAVRVIGHAPKQLLGNGH